MPIIACKHDHITGCYLLTRAETKLTRKEATEILMVVGIQDFEIKDTYTGKELFSLLLPDDLNISFKSSMCRGCRKCEFEKCPYDEYVVIKNGKLMKGVIDDNALGEKKGKLIDIIERRYDHSRAREFIDSVSKIALETISRKGFSISISDVDITDKSVKKIQGLVDGYNDTVEKMIRDYKAGRIEKIPGLSPEMTLENKILRLSGEISNEANATIRNDLPLNSAVIMARTGSRGSYVNLSQMCGFVGQESLEGERIHRGFINRTLSHFDLFDLGLKSRGFVFNSYKRGLDPFEFFFDAMNSRENLMDKSLHTRHSGYMERRLVNALQDLKVEYDGTVRDSRKRVVQFTAGEDGIDPAKSDSGKVKFESILS